MSTTASQAMIALTQSILTLSEGAGLEADHIVCDFHDGIAFASVSGIDCNGCIAELTLTRHIKPQNGPEKA